MGDLGPLIYRAAARQDLIEDGDVGAVLCGRKRRCRAHLLSVCGRLWDLARPWYDCVGRHNCCVGGSCRSLWIDREVYLSRLRLALGVGPTQHVDKVLAEGHVLGVRRISAARHSLVRWGTLLPAEEVGRKTLAVVVWEGHGQLCFNGGCLSWGLRTALKLLQRDKLALIDLDLHTVGIDLEKADLLADVFQHLWGFGAFCSFICPKKIRLIKILLNLLSLLSE